MTAKPFKLPLAVRIAIFVVIALALPLFLMERAIKKIRTRRSRR